MARTEIDVQEVLQAGVEITYEAFAQDVYGEGMAFHNTERTMIEIKQGVGNRNLIIRTPSSLDYAGLTLPDRTIVIPANKTRHIIVGKKFNQSDGKVYIDVDAVTNTTIAVMRI
jgi:hypothetical protein